MERIINWKKKNEKLSERRKCRLRGVLKHGHSFFRFLSDSDFMFNIENQGKHQEEERLFSYVDGHDD